MKGVIFSDVGSEPKIVDDLPMPEPGDDQVLVKSLWTAINPVDTFCSSTGLLVTGWPLTLGVDASGIITAAGPHATSKYHLEQGTHVFGCTRLGTPGYGTAAEYFLMDAPVCIPVTPKMNLTPQQTATLGVGLETACLGLFHGLSIPLDSVNEQKQKDEWIVILGGASSVGKYAIQVSLAAGFKVAASCSSRSAAVIEKLGAQPFDYKQSVEDQVKEVQEITSGKFRRVFDAAANSEDVARALFRVVSGEGRYFTTTNDWSGIGDFEGGKTSVIKLGEVGRPEAEELNANIEKLVPVIVSLLEEGKVTPSELEIIGGDEGGFGSAIEALRYQQTGKAGSRKVVVKIQDE